MSEQDIPERLERYGGDHISIKRIALVVPHGLGGLFVGSAERAHGEANCCHRSFHGPSDREAGRACHRAARCTSGAITTTATADRERLSSSG
jgi:hypothetical protein